MEADIDYLVSSEDLEYIKAHSKWKLTWGYYFIYVSQTLLYLIPLFFALLTELYFLLLLIIPYYLRFIIGCHRDRRFKSLVTPLTKEDNYKLVADFLRESGNISFKQFSEYIVVYPVLPFYRIKTTIVIIPSDKKILIGCILSNKYIGFSCDRRSLKKLREEIAARV